MFQHYNKIDAKPKSIYILPLGNSLSTTTINTLYSEIKRFLPNAKLLKGVPLPAHAYYRPRNRYRADTLIAWMRDMTKSNQIILGITGVDISITKNGQADFGVMGQGYCPGEACVASNFRLSNKGEFWKIAIHELGHNAGLPHCPMATCFMRDAEGGNPTREEKEFCPSCKDKLKMAGWKL